MDPWNRGPVDPWHSGPVEPWTGVDCSVLAVSRSIWSPELGLEVLPKGLLFQFLQLFGAENLLDDSLRVVL